MRFFHLGSKPRKPAYATAAGGRYDGRPLLILLENYVQAAIGCLPPDKEDLVGSITRRIFGGGPDWQATLRQTLNLQATLDEELRSMWDDSQRRAAEAGRPLSPADFARMVADENFGPLIEPAEP